jgi:hypothetical protein
VQALDDIADHERDDNTKIDSLEFKHALIYALPMKEKIKFDNILMNAEYLLNMFCIQNILNKKVN